MSRSLIARTEEALARIEAEGLTKRELPMTSPQSAHVRAEGGRDLLNLCANNYLGLADDERLEAAAKAAIDEHGLGMASVRFICGTSDLHKRLERRLADFLGTEDAILFPSCFDANGGLFEALLGPDDAIISDALNHASIIDGVRLSKARRLRYPNNDMEELEARLEESAGAEARLIVTDGVFSMDGILADLPEICALAEKHDALVMVDDSHAVGFVGDAGAGTPERFGVRDRVALLTGTFGKALGGAAGGYAAGPGPLIEMLRQRARPYLFSNALPPAIAAATLEALDILAEDPAPRERLRRNAAHFRDRMSELGFKLIPGEHPIVPVMLGDAKLAADFAEGMRARGVFVTAFSFPVVPRGLARIRTQMSAAHSTEDLNKAVDAFAAVGRELGAIR